MLTDTETELLMFYSWLQKQNYKQFVIVAGNHDSLIERGETIIRSLDKVAYLQDSGTEFEGLKIWGSPWTKSFVGMNPKCKAFTLETEEELAEKWKLIPEDTDILITHSPPYGIFDEIKNYSTGKVENIGSVELDERVQIIKPSLHVFGHFHGGYGMDQVGSVIFVNASHLNEDYEPVNKPIRVEL